MPFWLSVLPFINWLDFKELLSCSDKHFSPFSSYVSIKSLLNEKWFILLCMPGELLSAGVGVDCRDEFEQRRCAISLIICYEVEALRGTTCKTPFLTANYKDSSF